MMKITKRTITIKLFYRRVNVDVVTTTDIVNDNKENK